jgi:hypothetical protein
LLNSRHEELTLNDAVEFLKRSALERGEEPDPNREEKTVTVSKWIDGLEITESGNERATTTRQGIMRMLACCEEILKKKGRPFSRQPSVLHFFRSFSRARASSPLLFQTKCLLPRLLFVCQNSYNFYNFGSTIMYEYINVLSKNVCNNHPHLKL